MKTRADSGYQQLWLAQLVSSDIAPMALRNKFKSAKNKLMQTSPKPAAAKIDIRLLMSFLALHTLLRWGLNQAAQALQVELSTLNVEALRPNLRATRSEITLIHVKQKEKMLMTIQTVWILVVVFMLNACSAMTVNEHELQPGDPGGIRFQTKGKLRYDQVWKAATKAMSTDMVIVYSHKQSGTIKSRVGAAHTGKVVAFFITPTTPTAAQYTIELVSKEPMGFGVPKSSKWEPSVIVDFEAALNTQ